MKTMSQLTSICFCVFLTFLLVRGQKYTPVINTASGPVRGLILTSIENRDYGAFKGIPYAKPPLGYLRFKPPVQPDNWTDIYNATTESPACTQISTNGRYIPSSEDCLYINIYTPHTSFNESMLKPVMAWIPGGGFILGSANQTINGPDYIVGEDIIFVSFNYRLSAMGFLNLQHENATGNAGLKDQNFALKWIKKNIAYFGGNPDNVTLFGQSTGAASTDYHALSDMSRGLFSRTISMSGSPLNFYWGLQRRDEVLKNAFLLGSKLGTNTTSKDELLDTLYRASAVDIVNASILINLSPFVPTLEDPNIAPDQEKFLTECTPKKYASGDYTKVPHMMGFVSDEAAYYFRGGSKRPSLLYRARSALQLIQNSTENTPYFTNLSLAVDDALTNGLYNMTNVTYDVFELKNKLSDFQYALGVDAKHKLISQNNDHPIYYYRFSFKPANLSSIINETSLQPQGVGHTDDIPYVVYQSSDRVPLNQSDVVITKRRMVKLYTNFAKYGNPTPDGEMDELLGITWPDSRASGAQLEIGTDLSIATRQISENLKNLESLGFGDSLYFNDCSNN